MSAAEKSPREMLAEAPDKCIWCQREISGDGTCEQCREYSRARWQIIEGPDRPTWQQLLDRVRELEKALERIVELSSDRERFMMMGPRAFAGAEQIARTALRGGVEK